ncbi:hypothetical protein AC249_AIPGENE12858 [Exaiptasia diaphana]|nr:hypothetical protein AC249_AIPGENE12858 [Exaiptasia diaphana]
MKRSMTSEFVRKGSSPELLPLKTRLKSRLYTLIKKVDGSDDWAALQHLEKQVNAASSFSDSLSMNQASCKIQEKHKSVPSNKIIHKQRFFSTKKKRPIKMLGLSNLRRKKKERCSSTKKQNQSKVKAIDIYIIARSMVVSLRCRGTATFEDGAVIFEMLQSWT